MAIEEIDRVKVAGVWFDCVLADAGYGPSTPFHQAFSERCLAWAVGIPKRQKVYPADVTPIFPMHIPKSRSAAAQMLDGAKWRQVSRRYGTTGRLSARFTTSR